MANDDDNQRMIIIIIIKKKKQKIRQKHAFLHLKQIQNEYFMIHQLCQMMGAPRQLTTGSR